MVRVERTWSELRSVKYRWIGILALICFIFIGYPVKGTSAIQDTTTETTVTSATTEPSTQGTKEKSTVMSTTFEPSTQLTTKATATTVTSTVTELSTQGTTEMITFTSRIIEPSTYVTTEMTTATVASTATEPSTQSTTEVTSVTNTSATNEPSIHNTSKTTIVASSSTQGTTEVTTVPSTTAERSSTHDATEASTGSSPSTKSSIPDFTEATAVMSTATEPSTQDTTRVAIVMTITTDTSAQDTTDKSTETSATSRPPSTGSTLIPDKPSGPLGCSVNEVRDAATGVCRCVLSHFRQSEGQNTTCLEYPLVINTNITMDANFSDSLSNSSSVLFKDLAKSVSVWANNTFWPVSQDTDAVIGTFDVVVQSFRNGSIVANTLLRFAENSNNATETIRVIVKRIASLTGTTITFNNRELTVANMTVLPYDKCLVEGVPLCYPTNTTRCQFDRKTGKSTCECLAGSVYESPYSCQFDPCRANPCGHFTQCKLRPGQPFNRICPCMDDYFRGEGQPENGACQPANDAPYTLLYILSAVTVLVIIVLVGGFCYLMKRRPASKKPVPRSAAGTLASRVSQPGARRRVPAWHLSNISLQVLPEPDELNMARDRSCASSTVSREIPSLLEADYDFPNPGMYGIRVASMSEPSISTLRSSSMGTFNRRPQTRPDYANRSGQPRYALERSSSDISAESQTMSCDERRAPPREYSV